MQGTGAESFGEVGDLGRVKEGAAARLVGLNHEDGEVQGGGRGGVLRRGHRESDIRGLGGGEWVGNCNVYTLAQILSILTRHLLCLS